MLRVLLTGFEAFRQRSCNASWVAVSGLAEEAHEGIELRTLEIPVCWGAPRQALASALQDWQPDVIISLGEGEPGVFRLETRARNQRGEGLDNLGQQAPAPLIDDDGPEQLLASADCQSLLSALKEEDIPVQLSVDAGAYLCEELLYTLELLKRTRPGLHTVLFVHVPPYGTELVYRGQQTHCDEKVLLDFSRTLLTICSALVPK